MYSVCMNAEQGKLIYLKNFLSHKHDSETDLTFDITIVCDTFRGTARIETTLYQFNNFIDTLKTLYETFRGTAQIQDWWEDTYISFLAKKRGYIQIEGALYEHPHVTDVLNAIDNKFLFCFHVNQCDLLPFLNSLQTVAKEIRNITMLNP